MTMDMIDENCDLALLEIHVTINSRREIISEWYQKRTQPGGVFFFPRGALIRHLKFFVDETVQRNY